MRGRVTLDAIDENEMGTPMNDEKDRVYCTIDHTNKRGDGRDFDPYQFWLKQMKIRKEMEAAAKQRCDSDATARRKRQLT